MTTGAIVRGVAMAIGSICSLSLQFFTLTTSLPIVVTTFRTPKVGFCILYQNVKRPLTPNTEKDRILLAGSLTGSISWEASWSAQTYFQH